MREILFRGKRIDNGEWVKGHLIESKSFYNKPDEHSFIVNEHPQGCFERDIYIEVIPKTVSQYTGLTDKNGNKVFEGDVIKFYEHYCDIGYILYKNENAKFLYYTLNSSIVGYPIDDTCVFEVIGNIHDNPELLDGVNK